jgi:hypothetical protein
MLKKRRQKFQFFIKAWRKPADINLVSVFNFPLSTHLQESHDRNTSGRKKIG